MPNSARKAKSNSRPKLLAHTRPPVTNKPSLNSSVGTSSQSSKSTRTTIRSYHTLRKRVLQAHKAGDTALALALHDELEGLGGLEAYQAASTVGQSKQRGGDTSKVLVEWLQPVLKLIGAEDSGNGTTKPLRILEVGALSASNALNVPGKTSIRRLDLRSNDRENIEEMDFMDLDPAKPWKGQLDYDLLSLSLVVNFVEDPAGRGEMLRHSTRFLQRSAGEVRGRERTHHEMLPALFLVLPLPCVDNSRYLTPKRLIEIMASLGYTQTKVKNTNKLYYTLWLYQAGAEGQLDRKVRKRKSIFKKEELRSGKDRNNFSIVLEEERKDGTGSNVDS